MGIFSSKVEYKFLDQCEKHLSQLDNSLSSLASSMDSVHGTIKLLINQLEDVVSANTTDTEENVKPNNAVSTLTLTKDLLASVEHSLYHDKMALVQGVSQFIHLLNDKAEHTTLLSRHMPTLQNLSIDKYIADIQKKQRFPSNTSARQKSNLSNSSAGSGLEPKRSLEDTEEINKELEKEKSSLKLANVMLRTEHDELQMKFETSRKEVAKMSARNNALMEEKEQLRQDLEDAGQINKDLEKESSSLNLANVILRTETDELQMKFETSRNEFAEIAAKINTLAEENEQLRNDLEKSLHKIDLLPVQIYHQRSGAMMGFIEQELLNRLNAHFASDDKELDVIKCEKSSDIEPNKPLLVLCISTSRLGNDAVNAIQGYRLENTALLIFHHKDEHALPTQTSDHVLAGPEFKALGGIYDLAFLSSKGMYVCEMNNIAVANIKDFICKVREETCATRNISDARSSLLRR